jgi:cold shock protein
MGEAQRCGIVSNFYPDKGYGFLVGTDDGLYYFFHHSELPMEGNKSIEKSTKVQFTVGEGRNGRGQAQNITIITTGDYTG